MSSLEKFLLAFGLTGLLLEILVTPWLVPRWRKAKAHRRLVKFFRKIFGVKGGDDNE